MHFFAEVSDSALHKEIHLKKTSKIKHETLCNDYENGGIKNVDIFFKIASLQCSWIRRLFDSNFHQWKEIPLLLINKYLGKNLKFHSQLSFDKLL